MFTLNKKSICYLVSVFLLSVISVGVVYIVIDNQSDHAEDNVLSTLKPAPEGYQWYVTEEGGFAFLYSNTNKVSVCSEPALCAILGVVTGGIIIDNDHYDFKVVPGGRDGNALPKMFGDVEKIDIYPNAFGVTYMDTESRMTPERAEEYIREYYKPGSKEEPIIFTEQNRGIYDADYMKPLPPVFLITRAGVFKISTLANNPLQKDDYDPEICVTEFNEDYCPSPTRNYEDYAELPKYINTIIQSFTVIE